MNASPAVAVAAKTVTCRCGEQIRPCGVPLSPTLYVGTPDENWGNTSCCLLGWRHAGC